MARPKIKVMISSRCDVPFPLSGKGSKALSNIRRELKEIIESETLLGRNIFEVWINEDEPPEPGSKDGLQLCIDAVRNCDILLVIYNGDAGWSVDKASKASNGICHDELMTGYQEAPGKVCLVSIFEKGHAKAPKSKSDISFQDYVDSLNLFRGGKVANIEQLKKRAKEAVRETALKLMHDGAREAKLSSGNSGPALKWTIMNFAQRHAAMKNAIRIGLGGEAVEGDHEQGIEYSIQNTSIYFVPNAIPSAFTVSAAREMVGQPFLRDHEHLNAMSKCEAGPVHFIACQKAITEAQAMKVLGFPDATIVPGAFGIYVADNIQKIQLCLISGCIEASSTRHNIQKFLEWLDRSGEAVNLVERASARYRIVQAISGELE